MALACPSPYLSKMGGYIILQTHLFSISIFATSTCKCFVVKLNKVNKVFQIDHIDVT